MQQPSGPSGSVVDDAAQEDRWVQLQDGCLRGPVPQPRSRGDESRRCDLALGWTIPAGGAPRTAGPGSGSAHRGRSVRVRLGRSAVRLLAERGSARGRGDPAPALSPSLRGPRCDRAPNRARDHRRARTGAGSPRGRHFRSLLAPRTATERWSSTGFAPWRPRETTLSDHDAAVAEACRPIYAALHARRVRV